MVKYAKNKFNKKYMILKHDKRTAVSITNIIPVNTCYMLWSLLTILTHYVLDI
jgi:hypothetical protein